MGLVGGFKISNNVTSQIKEGTPVYSTLIIALIIRLSLKHYDYLRYSRVTYIVTAVSFSDIPVIFR